MLKRLSLSYIKGLDFARAGYTVDFVVLIPAQNVEEPSCTTTLEYDPHLGDEPPFL